MKNIDEMGIVDRKRPKIKYMNTAEKMKSAFQFAMPFSPPARLIAADMRAFGG